MAKKKKKKKKKKKLIFEIDEILPYFDALEDPRSSINQLHPLVSVVVISLMAVLAGASGPTAIARWANMKEELLRKLLPLPHGIPQKDVYRRVLSLLPEALKVQVEALRLQSASRDILPSSECPTAKS